jgi:hypothetical protein
VLRQHREPRGAHVRDELGRPDAVPAALGHALQLAPAGMRRHLDHQHAPARLERAPQAAPHRLRVREVVVDHAQQDRVAAAVRQSGVRLVAQHRPHVRDAVRLRPVLDVRQLVRLDLGRVDEPGRADLACQHRREPALAGSDVGRGHARTQGERLHDLLALVGAGERDEECGSDQQQPDGGGNGSLAGHVRSLRGTWRPGCAPTPPS